MTSQCRAVPLEYWFQKMQKTLEFFDKKTIESGAKLSMVR